LLPLMARQVVVPSHEAGAVRLHTR
jgi:hypothetical protein